MRRNLRMIALIIEMFKRIILHREYNQAMIKDKKNFGPSKISKNALFPGPDSVK